MYLVDTNIFLEVMLLQKRKADCEKFLELLKTGKNSGVITDFSIHSIIVIMSSLNKTAELRTFLQSLTAYKGLHIHCTTILEEIKATAIVTEQKLDMDDAIQLQAAITACADAIVSYDKHFNNLNIPRKEPQQIQ